MGPAAPAGTRLTHSPRGSRADLGEPERAPRVSGSPSTSTGSPTRTLPYGASGTPDRGGASGTPGRGGASGTRFIANRVLPPIVRCRARLTSGSLVRTAVSGSMVVSTHRMHGVEHPELDLADPDPPPAVLGERRRSADDQVRSEPGHRHGTVGGPRSVGDPGVQLGQGLLRRQQHREPVGEGHHVGGIGHLRDRPGVVAGHPGRPGAAVARWPRRTSRRRSPRLPGPGVGRPRSSRPPAARTPVGRRPGRRPRASSARSPRSVIAGVTSTSRLASRAVTTSPCGVHQHPPPITGQTPRLDLGGVEILTTAGLHRITAESGEAQIDRPAGVSQGVGLSRRWS